MAFRAVSYRLSRITSGVALSGKPAAILDGVRGVVFDMDGTLVLSDLDFDAIRTEAGVPDGTPVLEYVASSGEEVRARVLAVLEAHEEAAARQCDLLPGADDVLTELRARGFRLALLTRNSCSSVRVVLERHGLQFDACVAREDAAPKPSPEPVLKIAGMLEVAPSELLVVGDYVFDVQSGQAAGARTALLDTGKGLDIDPPPDIVLQELTELPGRLPRRAVRQSELAK